MSEELPKMMALLYEWCSWAYWNGVSSRYPRADARFLRSEPFYNPGRY